MREVFAILDSESLEQALKGLLVTASQVTRGKQLMTYTAEDGAEIADHAIDEPRVVTVDGVVVGDGDGLWAELFSAFDSSRKLAVQTGNEIITPMVIVEAPYASSASFVDGSQVSLRLQEWREVAPEWTEFKLADVQRPAQASTVRAGVQAEELAPAEAERRQGLLYKYWTGR